VTSITDPLANVTTFEYDTQGNLTTITEPDENLKPEPERLKTRMTYNTCGQVLTVTDPLNQTTTFTYTDGGDLATVTDPPSARPPPGPTMRSRGLPRRQILWAGSRGTRTTS
jgi:YD repeat-containing protein